MPTTYQHKALIDELKKLSSVKAAENPSEEVLDSTHPSADDSADSDNTTEAVVGSRFAENSQANKEMNPQGTESAADNSGDLADYGHNAAPSGEGDVPVAKADDPQDPASSHPASGKESSVEDLLKSASEIGAALRGLIKGASDVPDATREFSDDASGTAPYPEDNDNITVADEDGSTTASKEGMQQVICDFKAAAAQDADSFATVCLAIIGNSTPMKQAMDEIAEALVQGEEAAPEEAAPEEAVPEEEAEAEEAAPEEEAEAEEILADMAMADAAPAEEASLEEALAAEEAPIGAEEELTPEEQALLMELLAAEGMGGEDVAAYGKMSAAIDRGFLKLETLPKVQQNYYRTCENAAKSAAAKVHSLKLSAALAGDLNSIYNREAK